MIGTARDLGTYPAHLGSGGRAETQPAFTGMDWYEAYALRTAADGRDGRLVFTSDWNSWEMHPAGVWHTANVPSAATTLFITRGKAHRAARAEGGVHGVCRSMNGAAKL